MKCPKLQPGERVTWNHTNPDYTPAGVRSGRVITDLAASQAYQVAMDGGGQTTVWCDEIISDEGLATRMKERREGRG